MSSFGVSGTNAHVILEQAVVENAPAEVTAETPADRSPAAAVPLLLSAATEPALRAQAAAWRGHLAAQRPTGLARTGHALLTARAALEHRTVTVASDPDRALTALAALAQAEETPHAVSGTADVEGRRAFVFPGQGAQWVGMGRRLLDESPVFARAVAEV
ncbi:acyltransferase domain-containing protein, partial [Streptomyces minutiscleroticus]|uniref:acyltransferase domain-containing protein n=1 Tax=Streptomyces minutiscleroticus TaxID=68238 RepID=UPI003570AE51